MLTPLRIKGHFFIKSTTNKNMSAWLSLTSAQIPPKGNKREDSPRVQKQDRTMHPLPNVIFDKVLVQRQVIKTNLTYQKTINLLISVEVGSYHFFLLNYLYMGHDNMLNASYLIQQLLKKKLVPICFGATNKNPRVLLNCWLHIKTNIKL